MVVGKYLLPFRAQKSSPILCRNNFHAIGFCVTAILLYNLYAVGVIYITVFNSIRMLGQFYSKITCCQLGM